MTESVVCYGVIRLTVEGRFDPAEFQSRYEQAIPPFPAEQVAELVRRQAPWQDTLDLMASASPLGFFLFYKINVAPTVRLAGDKAFGVAYLMGNNTLMESMFRYEPAILLYGPLHIVMWGDPDGPGYLTFDKPSDQFGSFGRAEVSKVGVELTTSWPPSWTISPSESRPNFYGLTSPLTDSLQPTGPARGGFGSLSWARFPGRG